MDKLLVRALISIAQTMGAWVCKCVFVCGNDIAVKSDLQSPLAPAYWVVCFAEWLFDVGIIEMLLDGQLDTLINVAQYFLWGVWGGGWSVYVWPREGGGKKNHKKEAKVFCRFLI